MGVFTKASTAMEANTGTGAWSLRQAMSTKANFLKEI